MSPSFTWLACLVVVALAVQFRVSSAANTPASDADRRAQSFISEHEANIRPLEIAVNEAWWKANTTGKDEDFAAKEKAQNELDQALSDTKRFAELKAIRDAKPSDTLL